jgi:hypothetical protein
MASRHPGIRNDRDAAALRRGGPGRLLWLSVHMGLGLLPVYQISGPPVFTGSSDLYPATSVSGISAGVVSGIQRFVIDSAYVDGSPIVSGATYVGKSLSDLGLNSASGNLGTWTLVGTSETISINVTSPTPPTPSVPGPLPLLGAGAAFGFSRQLRNRIKSRQIPA